MTDEYVVVSEITQGMLESIFPALPKAEEKTSRLVYDGMLLRAALKAGAVVRVEDGHSGETAMPLQGDGHSDESAMPLQDDVVAKMAPWLVKKLTDEVKDAINKAFEVPDPLS